ncbi:thioesterase [Candidatus Marinimicrobia bacterium]|nr:thioesterase [Candidatus Neomarinimicrobiota bacterium]
MIKFFSITKLPLAIITGIKIQEINYSVCKTNVSYGYLTKNPFNSTYFAVQSMAAELSTGTLSLIAVKGINSVVSFILNGLRDKFLKKSKGRIEFVCKEEHKLHNIVKKAREKTGSQQEETIFTIGYGSDGEIVSKFEFTWSFKCCSTKL